MPVTQNIHKGIAVITASVFLCTPFCTSAQISTISHKGNVFELKNMTDTTEILDPVTMETLWEIRNPNPIPLKLNNMNIYAVNEVESKPSVSGETLRRLIISQLSAHIKKDGEYRLLLDNVVVSDKGKIVYYDFNGIENKVTIQSGQTNSNNSKSYDNVAKTNRWEETDKNRSASLAPQIEKTIDKAPVYKPAMVYSQPVPCLLDTKELQRPFFVKGGVILY